jgi:hypothetical protein
MDPDNYRSEQISVWRYIIVNDSGAAPNYDPPFVTLAVCKPRIRKRANPDDIIIAFEGKACARQKGRNCQCNRLVWAGVVKKRIPFDRYWNDARFRSKKPREFGGKTPTPDNIYRPHGLKYAQVRNSTHGPESTARDLGGVHALIIEPAWRFDDVELPERFSYLNWKGRYLPGHRRDEIDRDEAAELKEWLADAGAVALRSSRKSRDRRPKHRC